METTIKMVKSGEIKKREPSSFGYADLPPELLTCTRNYRGEIRISQNKQDLKVMFEIFKDSSGIVYSENDSIPKRTHFGSYCPTKLRQPFTGSVGVITCHYRL